jgi:HEXXH motif-containing protein
LIGTHSLSADAFMTLASGVGDATVVRSLREAQLSKHLMLLRVVAEAADGADPASPEAAAFRAGYRLLAELQAADPGAVAWLVSLPHFGSWAHDCLACLDEGSSPDFAYLACAAAAAAARSGIRFELDVPVRDGRVLLPGLGQLRLPGQPGQPGQPEWIRLDSDGERLRAGEHVEAPCAVLVPDDGSGAESPHWLGTPLIRAAADGQLWEVLLEVADRHLDRFTLPMLPAMTAAEVANWRERVQAAWEVLVRHHGWAAGPIAHGAPVIVPLVPKGDLDSATSPAAFGAIATSWPPSAVSMAETLVHEFQHIKLCGVMDMWPLIAPCEQKSYAPWREDPRPAGGLLQGAYAFAGISRFWGAQRHVETEPDDILRANVLYERWRSTIGPATDTLLKTGALTPTGVRFVRMLREQGWRLQAEPVPAVAREIAEEVALDNWLTWQLRHIAVDAAGVARLAAAYKRGEPLGDQALPDSRIEDDTRKVDSVARSRMLNTRYQEPRRYQRLRTSELPELGAGDGLLVRGNASAAIAAYREEITADPRTDAWIGLALAIHRLPDMPSRPVFATRLPHLLEVHACLADQGIRSDPLELAAWFE